MGKLRERLVGDSQDEIAADFAKFSGFIGALLKVLPCAGEATSGTERTRLSAITVQDYFVSLNKVFLSAW